MQYSNAGYASTSALAPPTSFDQAGFDTLAQSTPTSQAFFHQQQQAAAANGFGPSTSYQPSPTWPNAAPRMAPPTSSMPATPAMSNAQQQRPPSQAPAGPPYELLPELAAFAATMNPEQVAQLRAMPPERQHQIRDAMISRSRQHLMSTAAASSAGSPQASTSAPAPVPVPNAGANQAASAQFMQKLREFNVAKGTPLDPVPMFDGRPIDLFRLFVVITHRGGGLVIHQGNQWKLILAIMGVSPDMGTTPPTYSDAKGAAMANFYATTLGPYEVAFRADQARRNMLRNAQSGATGMPTSQAEASTGSPPNADAGVGRGAPQQPTVTATPLAAANGMSPPAPMPVPASPGKSKPLDILTKSMMQQPAEPPAPKRRKRQKVEYAPYTRSADTMGGWHVEGIESTSHSTNQMRRPRAAADLGNVDIYSLVMSIRSRIPSELSYALNSLSLIFADVLAQRVPFRLKDATGVLDELIELFEETAFGPGGQGSPTATSGKRGRTTVARPTSYRAMAFAALEQRCELDPRRRDGKRAVQPIGRAELLSIVLTLLRLLACVPINHDQLIQHPTLIPSLLRACAMGDHAGDDMAFLSLLDLLDLRKDVFHIIYDLASRISLASTQSIAAASAFHLVTFFLLDSPETQHTADYSEMALAAFSRLFVTDGNREPLSKASIRPLELYEHFIRSLPLTEAEFAQLATYDGELTRGQMLAIAIFNLIFVASPAQRARYRDLPGATMGLLRTIRKLLIISSRDPKRKADCDAMATRILASLALLNDDEGPGAGGSAEAVVDDRGPWFGSVAGGKPSATADEEASEGDGHRMVTGPAPIFAASGRAGYLAQFSMIPMEDHLALGIAALFERQSKGGRAA